MLIQIFIKKKVVVYVSLIFAIYKRSIMESEYYATTKIFVMYAGSLLKIFEDCLGPFTEY